jgi:hypothetical protein
VQMTRCSPTMSVMNLAPLERCLFINVDIRVGDRLWNCKSMSDSEVVHLAACILIANNLQMMRIMSNLIRERNTEQYIHRKALQKLKF